MIAFSTLLLALTNPSLLSKLAMLDFLSLFLADQDISVTSDNVVIIDEGQTKSACQASHSENLHILRNKAISHLPLFLIMLPDFLNPVFFRPSSVSQSQMTKHKIGANLKSSVFTFKNNTP